MTFATDKMDGRGLINTARCVCLPKKTKVMQQLLATEGLPERQSASVIKVSGRMRSSMFKRRLALSFTVILSA